MDTAANIVGVILAGGASRRMGGGDKSLRTLAGQPMLAHVVRRFTSQVGRTIISANGDPQRFDCFDLPVVADQDFVGHGPLSGFLAGMIWARQIRAPMSAIVTVSTDVPFLPGNLVEKLLQCGGANGAIAVSDGRQHPVIGLWPLSLENEVRTNLQQGQRSVEVFASRSGAAKVEFEALTIGGTLVDPFFNANTPDDLDAAETILSGST